MKRGIKGGNRHKDDKVGNKGSKGDEIGRKKGNKRDTCRQREEVKRHKKIIEGRGREGGKK